MNQIIHQPKGVIKNCTSILKNVTPAEVYFGTAERKLRKRKQTKNRTLKARKKQYQNFKLN